MEDQDSRSRSPSRYRAHLSAVIASLFASLLLLFGGDVLSRSHPRLSSHGALLRTDAGHATAGAHSETRFLVSSEQSSRPKLRPSGSGDGFLCPDIQQLWMCRNGDVVQRRVADSAPVSLPLAYRSRAPPIIQHAA
jgi:hypothetical protein